MMKRFLAPVLVLVFLIGGCTTRYAIDDSASPSTEKLESNQSMYVAVPQDGSFGNTVYEESGQKTAAFLRAELLPHASVITVGRQAEESAEALDSAKAADARYVFVPVITNWVHRKAAWSGRSSGVSLTVTVYDLATEDEAAQKIVQKDLRVQGRNVTLVSQHPEEIVKPLLKRFVESLF